MTIRLRGYTEKFCYIDDYNPYNTIIKSRSVGATTMVAENNFKLAYEACKGFYMDRHLSVIHRDVYFVIPNLTPRTGCFTGPWFSDWFYPKQELVPKVWL